MIISMKKASHKIYDFSVYIRKSDNIYKPVLMEMGVTHLFFRLLIYDYFMTLDLLFNLLTHGSHRGYTWGLFHRKKFY